MSSTYPVGVGSRVPYVADQYMNPKTCPRAPYLSLLELSFNRAIPIFFVL